MAKSQQEVSRFRQQVAGIWVKWEMAAAEVHVVERLTNQYDQLNSALRFHYRVYFELMIVDLCALWDEGAKEALPGIGRRLSKCPNKHLSAYVGKNLDFEQARITGERIVSTFEALKKDELKVVKALRDKGIAHLDTPKSPLKPLSRESILSITEHTKQALHDLDAVDGSIGRIGKPPFFDWANQVLNALLQ